MLLETKKLCRVGNQCASLLSTPFGGLNTQIETASTSARANLRLTSCFLYRLRGAQKMPPSLWPHSLIVAMSHTRD